MNTLPKSLATVLEKRLLLDFTGNEVQKRTNQTTAAIFLKTLKCEWTCSSRLYSTLLYEPLFPFIVWIARWGRSYTTDGSIWTRCYSKFDVSVCTCREAYLTWEICSDPLRCWSRRWNHRELWEPTKVVIKRDRISPKRGLLLASFTKSYANTDVEIIKGHLSESRQGQLTHAVE